MGTGHWQRQGRQQPPPRPRLCLALAAPLLLLALACSSPPATAAFWPLGGERWEAGAVGTGAVQRTAASRALRASGRAGGGGAQCCLEVELQSPFLEAGVKPPPPGTRFVAAKARVVRCGPLRSCRGQVTLVPTAELGRPAPAAAEGVQNSSAVDCLPFSLTMFLTVPSATALTPAWPPSGEAREPPVGVLAPSGTWTHFAGDSLLRGAFSTLAQFFRKATWEQWKGEAHYQSVFQCVPPACSGACRHAHFCRIASDPC